MTYTFDEQCISDLYKDVYNFRPAPGFWQKWNTASMSDRQAIWDSLCDVLDRQLLTEKDRQARACDEWRARMQKTAQEFGVSVDTAVRWDVDCHEVDGDISFYCFKNDLPYSMIEEITEMTDPEKVFA